MSVGSNPTLAQVIIHENVNTEFLNLAVYCVSANCTFLPSSISIELHWVHHQADLLHAEVPLILLFLERDDAAYTEMLDEKKNKMLQVQKELDEQKNKLDRAQKQNSKLAREVRSAAGSKSELPEEVKCFVTEQ